MALLSLRAVRRMHRGAATSSFHVAPSCVSFSRLQIRLSQPNARRFITLPGLPTPEEEEDGPDTGKRGGDGEPRWKPIFWKALESTATTLASVSVLG